MSEIQIVNLNEIYPSKNKGVAALKGISLDLNEGEICVLLGPNGADKTTLVKMNRWQSVMTQPVRFVMNLNWFRERGLVFLHDFTTAFSRT